MHTSQAGSELRMQLDTIREQPMGLVVVVDGAGRPHVDTLPMLLDEPPAGAVLLGQISRRHGLFPLLDDGAEVLIVFQDKGCALTEITKAALPDQDESAAGRYEATVQVRGHLRYHEDPAWFIDRMHVMYGGEEADLREEYIQARIRAMVGFEIRIDEIKGDFKVNRLSTLGTETTGLSHNPAMLARLLRTFAGSRTEAEGSSAGEDRRR